MLEADYVDKDLEMSRRTQKVDDVVTLSNDYMMQQRHSFISFSVFLQFYWRHFPQNLTKGLGKTISL